MRKRVTSSCRASRQVDPSNREFTQTPQTRKGLKEEAVANAERDLALAVDWFAIEEEISSRTEH